MSSGDPANERPITLRPPTLKIHCRQQQRLDRRACLHGITELARLHNASPHLAEKANFFCGKSAKKKLGQGTESPLSFEILVGRKFFQNHLDSGSSKQKGDKLASAFNKTKLYTGSTSSPYSSYSVCVRVCVCEGVYVCVLPSARSPVFVFFRPANLFNNSRYLKNSARYGTSLHDPLIRSRIRPFDWYQTQWP